MNIAAYCRVSTDKSDQLNSLEAQKKFFQEYAQKNRHNLIRLYADEGISGTKTKNRTEFLRLMRDAREGLFDIVAVKDISRFARNTVDFLQSIRTLKALGIETVFLTANMTSLGNSEFILTIFGALAQEESANTSKRIKFGKQLNAEKGRVPNLVYGYDKTAGDYFSLAVNAREAAVVRRIYDWYTEGGYGAMKIAAMLNDRGEKTKRGCNWSQNAVSRILSNELYTGKIINGKQEVSDFLTGARKSRGKTEWLMTERPELSIVAAEQFHKARKLMAGRGQAFRTARERQSNKHPFSTLIRCKSCGWAFRRTVRTYKNTYVRWVCSGHNGKGTDACPNAAAVDEDELISTMESYFADFLKSRSNIMKTAFREFSRMWQTEKDNETRLKELRSSLSKLKKTREKYMDMYSDDLIARSELNEKLTRLKEENRRLENELLQVSGGREEDPETVFRRAFAAAEDIVSVRSLTNAQLKQLIRKIEVDPFGNVDIFLRPWEDFSQDQNVPIWNVRT